MKLTDHIHRFRLLIATLVLLCVFSVAVFLMPHREAVPNAPVTVSMEQLIRNGVAPVPTLTEEMKKKLAEVPVFHALASYTDRGFEPRVAIIKKGETVRFTNNSARTVWIASDNTNTAAYPQASAVCDSSALDSCGPVAPMDFWQFTFDIPGTWEVMNNLEKQEKIKIIVE